MPRTAEANEFIKQKKRNLILKTSLRLFCETGYNNVTMDKIAKECKISHGLIYHYYEKKSDILVDLLSIQKQKFNEILSYDDFRTEKGSQFFEKYVQMILTALSLKGDYPYFLYLKLNVEIGSNYESFFLTPMYKNIEDNYKIAIKEGKFAETNIREHILCLFFILESLISTSINNKGNVLLPPVNVIMNVLYK